MAIVRKPGASMASECEIESVINKGGGVASAGAARSPGGRKIGKVLLRVPEDLLSRVDGVVGAKPLPTTRHAWLLEAVLEKLERESN